MNNKQHIVTTVTYPWNEVLWMWKPSLLDLTSIAALTSVATLTSAAAAANK